MITQAARILIKLVPESIGYTLTAALAARTRRAPVSPLERDALATASKYHFGTGKAHVAWVWGTGPLVILVHGWGGRAAQMAPLGAHIARLGFRAVAIDVTGHGDSPGHNTRWEYFLADIAAIAQAMNEDVHACVAHSAGALTTMAARSLKGLRATRYACICAPSHPYPPIELIQKKLNPGKGIVERYKNHIAQQFNATWERLQTGASFVGSSSDLLLVYDTADRFVSHGEGEKILAMCPGATLVKTNGYGHTRILVASELAKVVGEFLTAKS